MKQARRRNVKRIKNNKAAAGFTLLEMLVVLVVVGLISTLMIQGLMQTLLLRARFQEHLSHLYVDTVREYWFRSTVRGLMPDYPDPKRHDFFQARAPVMFKGDRESFSGLTMAALDEDSGVPTAFAWELGLDGGEHILRYRTGGGQAWKVLHWQGEAGQFQYQAKDGSWHDTWPPAFGQEPPQLPEAIEFRGRNRRNACIWLVSVPGLKEPRPDYRLML